MIDKQKRNEVLRKLRDFIEENDIRISIDRDNDILIDTPYGEVDLFGSIVSLENINEWLNLVGNR